MHILNRDVLDALLASDPAWANKTQDDAALYVFDKVKSLFGLTTMSLCLVVFYATLFAFGLVGNLWVISVVVYILKALRSSVPNHNVFYYVLCLSAVDSLVLMIIPMLISDIVFYRWLFGPVLCKMYFIIETSNKLLSTFILAALSCDRFLAVCYPNSAFKMRSPKMTVLLVCSLFIFVTILLAPLHYSSGESITEESVQVGNFTVLVGLPRCNLAMTTETMIVFTVYLFVIGFCIPGVLITYFYVKVLCRVYSHAKKLGDNRTQIPVRRVTLATLMVVVFYFMCWTPYWTMTIYLMVTPEPDYPEPQKLQYTNEEGAVVLVSYFFHSLVYVNSAFNWVFYALLNKHLRESHDAALERNRSISLTTKALRARLLPSTNGMVETFHTETPAVYFDRRCSSAATLHSRIRIDSNSVSNCMKQSVDSSDLPSSTEKFV